MASWPERLVVFLLVRLKVFRLAWLWVDFFDWVGSWKALLMGCVNQYDLLLSINSKGNARLLDAGRPQ